MQKKKIFQSIIIPILMSVFVWQINSQSSKITDSDKDGISDFVETTAGLDPNKDECIPNQCGKLSFNGIMGTDNIIIILDQSGSMEAPLDSQTRMEAAKKVTTKYMDRLPEYINFGLYTYGHKSGCDPLFEIQSPFSKPNKKALAQKIAELKSTGLTPIGKSLEMLGKKLAGKKGKFQILLVTDREESCGGDPLKEANKLASMITKDLSIQLNIIGIGLSSTTGDYMNNVANALGGSFENTNSTTELDNKFQKPLKEIFTNFKNMICLQTQVDKLLSCEQGRKDKIIASEINLSSDASKEDKKLFMVQKAEAEKSIQSRIDNYKKIKEEGISKLTDRINDLSKIMLP